MKWQFWEGCRESNGDSNVWCKTDDKKEDRGPSEDVLIEGNSGSDSKGDLSDMVQACVEEGWWACFEKSIRVWSEGQGEVRITKENMEDASGEGKQECWFWRRRMPWIEWDGEWELERLLLEWVNPATLIYGDKPRSKLDAFDWLIELYFFFNLYCNSVMK